MTAYGSAKKCGFVGLGSQGAPIARRMVDAGFDVALWARRPETLTSFRATKARFASTLRDLAASVDHFGICVLNDAGVNEIGAEIIPLMREGSVIAVHSTVLPQTCRTLAAEASRRGVLFVDAPVSGGPPAAQAGTLTIMAAGSKEAIAAAQPVFEAFAGLIVHLGEAGAGQAAKILNNSLMAANLGLADAAVTAGVELGLDRVSLLQLLNASSGKSFALETYARMASPQSFAHGASLLSKDVALLGAMLGATHATFKALDDAAQVLLDKAASGTSAL